MDASTVMWKQLVMQDKRDENGSKCLTVNSIPHPNACTCMHFAYPTDNDVIVDIILRKKYPYDWFVVIINHS